MPDRLIGRTAVFGTVSQGSSPCRATSNREQAFEYQELAFFF